MATTSTAACQASPSLTIFQSLPKNMSSKLVMPPSHLILCCPLLLLPSTFPSIRVFPNVLALHISCLTTWAYIPRLPRWLSIRNLPATQKMQFQSLGQEDPLEEGMATQSSILAGKNPTDRMAWWATAHKVTKSQTRLKQLNMPDIYPEGGLQGHMVVLFLIF